MASSAATLRWSDSLASHLPQPLRESGIPPQYFVVVPATLLVLLLSYSINKASSARSSQAHLVSASSESYTTKRSLGKSPTVLLVGLPDSGKTSLFSSLVYQTTPSTVPSQRLSQGLIETSTLGDDITGAKAVNLIDLPGHPRLRPLVDEYINQADALVICVDAVMASKPNMGAASRPGDAESVTDVADLIHSTLTSLARMRSKSSSDIAPPSVLVLFTRADLSPLLGGSSSSASATASSGTDSSKEEKRKAQLLSRCRTTLEAELGQRRSNMGLGKRRGGVKIAGLGKVADGEPSSLTGGGDGIFGWIKKALGLAGKASGSAASANNAADDDEEEDLDEMIDYIDWAAAQRAMEASSETGTGGTSSFSFEKLDDQVVFGGKVEFALCSVGKQRGWVQPEDIKLDSNIQEFKSWLIELQK